MTTKQMLYIKLVKRPVGFVGALVALVVLSPAKRLTIRSVCFVYLS